MQIKKEIHFIFNPGKKADVPLRSITAVQGDKVGAMPKPVRRGYSFVGWYTFPQGENLLLDGLGGCVASDHEVDERFTDEDIILYAHWKKISSRERRSSQLNTQRRAVAVMAILAVTLTVALIIVNYIVSIYKFTDEDGTKYTIKKKDGVYGLCYNGEVCDKNDEGYYQTNLGTLVSVDAKTGEDTVYAVVHTGGTETLGYNRRVLMFKQLTYDMSATTDMSKVIDRIEIHNEYGKTTYIRGDSNRFYIEGHKETVLDDELFAALASGCGYTIAMDRLTDPVKLSDGSIDLSEYGLTSEIRTKTEYPNNSDDTSDIPSVSDKDEEVTVEYEYTPAWYTITTVTGQSHTVIIGDKIVSGTGYYAMYEGRDTVYILASANFDSSILVPVETLVTPMITYPSTLDTAHDVENFVYRSNIDYKGLYLDLYSKYLGLDKETLTSLTAEQLKEYEDRLDQVIENTSEEEFEKDYNKALENNSNIVTSFSYIPISERENLLYSSVPYKMATEYMDGYLPNSNNISNVLQLLYSMTFSKVEVLGPNDVDFEKYGLDKPAHIITYTYHIDSKNNAYNHIEISEKATDGVYYAYSPDYDMIVSFEESQAPYLEWEEIDWYEKNYFLANIAHTTQIKLESPEFSVTFDLDNSASITTDRSDSDTGTGIASDKLVVYADGKRLKYNLKVTKPSGSIVTEDEVYNFRRFFSSLLSASLEGVADLTEEQMQTFRTSPDSECQLKLTISLDDSDYAEAGTAQTSNLVIRFYQYSERRSYITIETLDTPDSPSSPENAQGKFYVLRSFCDKLIADAERVVNGVEVVVESKS